MEKVTARLDKSVQTIMSVLSADLDTLLDDLSCRVELFCDRRHCRDERLGYEDYQEGDVVIMSVTCTCVARTRYQSCPRYDSDDHAPLLDCKPIVDIILQFFLVGCFVYFGRHVVA